MILNQIDIKEVDTHDIQKENFPEYNKKVYIFKNYEFSKASKKETLTSECMYCKNEIIEQRKV